MNQTTAAKKNGLFYGWIIVVVSTLALVVSNGLSTTGIPVFYKAVREEFVAVGAVQSGYAESFIANGAYITFLMSGVFSLVGGWLATKFKLRNIMIFGCVLLGGGLLLHSQTDSPNAVYFSRFLMGASLGFVGVAPNVLLVSNWFSRLRGTAIGIILTGTSFGGVLIPLIATPLIMQYGWRTAMVFVSLIVWLILLPAVLFLVKNKPEGAGLLPDGAKNQLRITNYELRNENNESQTEWESEKQKNSESKNRENRENKIQNPKSKIQNPNAGYTLAQAIKTPLFWIFALCAAMIFYPIFVTSQQFILYLQTPKIGLSAQSASIAQSSLFAVSVGGKFLFGFLSDRFAPARVMLLCCLLMFAATFVLLALSANTAFLFLIPFGLGYGGTFVLLQRLVADFFGTREYGKILGLITVIETVGAAIGGKITASLADSAGGDYTRAFYGVILTTGAALVLVILLNFYGQSQNRRREINF
jgi:MFS family permease